MKRLSVLAVCLLVLCLGCADHYHKLHENMVSVYLKLPEAQQVLFLSSLDGYEKHEARKINKKTWEIIVHAEPEFKYFYIVDGKSFLPTCPLKEADDFGSENCIFSTER